MSISVLGASQLGNTQADRTKAAEDKAREKREEMRKKLITADNYQSMTNEDIAAAKKNSSDVITSSNVTRNQRILSGDRSSNAELKKLKEMKTNANPSSCTVSGGKRRKTRKHRGSRKNKKSRRR